MNQTEMRTYIVEHFNDDELRDLCFELGIDYESLTGSGKSAKARELVSFCERHGRFADLEQVSRQLHSKPASTVGLMKNVPSSSTLRLGLLPELEQRERNLMKLRQQAALYAAGEVPLHVLNQIEAEERLILEIKNRNS
jgi:hypothetical protein